MTKHGRLAIQDATDEARRYGTTEILPEHLLLALLPNDNAVQRNQANQYLPKPVASVVLETVGVSLPHLRSELEAQLRPIIPPEEGQMLLSAAVQSLIPIALQQAEDLGGKYIGTEHLLLALLQMKGSAACDLLMKYGVNWQQAHDEIKESYS